MRLLLIFLIFSATMFSQNSDTYLAIRLQEDIYQYFDSLGVEQTDDEFPCDCSDDFESSISFFVKSKEKKQSDLDTNLLETLDDEDVEFYSKQYNNNISKNYNNLIKQINIRVNIKRKYVRFNIFRFKWKIKYIITVTYNYNPKNEKKEN